MSTDLNHAAKMTYALAKAAAAIYRTLGAEVEEDISIAGCQFDLLVRLNVPGEVLRCAVDCKAYSSLVGVKTLYRFHSEVQFLRERGAIDKGVLISITGFTKSALKYAKSRHIELVKLSELQERLRGREDEVIKRVDVGFAEEFRQQLSGWPGRKRVFVVMPFARKFEDVYVIGIREVAERLGLVVERADDIEHDDQILQVVQQKIRDHELIVADITTPNPNVFYEVGYAHACGKTTILISDKEQKTPFDLQSFNIIFYESLIDLREKLERRIRSHLPPVASGSFPVLTN